MMLVQNASNDPGPLRTAMHELITRSSGTSAGKSREYLYGTIVSQLVPDEARILAALAGGKAFAAVDVMAKHVGRSRPRLVLANASSVGSTAGVAHARQQHLPHPATKLRAGRVRPAKDELGAEYDQLAIDDAVQEARVRIEAASWAACASSASRWHCPHSAGTSGRPAHLNRRARYGAVCAG